MNSPGPRRCITSSNLHSSRILTMGTVGVVVLGIGFGDKLCFHVATSWSGVS